MDFLFYVVLLLIGGCFAGFMAGLLGIGGGIIITPIQYYLLISMGIDDKIALTVTFATGLAVIGLTMVNSTRMHKENGLIVYNHLKSMLILSFIATIIGAMVSQYIDVGILKTGFGLVCILSTIVLVMIDSPENLGNAKTNGVLLNSVAIFGAFISGLIGPAGAAIVIPIFIAYLKYPITNTIGTNSALSISVSLAGVLAYIILGLGIQGLPDFSLG